MIFIVGSHPKITRYRCTRLKHCFWCNNDSYWVLEKQQQFLSLFFLSVLPLQTTYLCSCPVCGNTEFLGPEAFEQKVKNEAIPL